MVDVAVAPLLSLGAYQVRGLLGGNNAGSPTTQFDLSADAIVLRNPATGGVAVSTNVATITDDVTVAGPVANGRDQAGAFGASSWIHFYFIWNNTTLATIASATAPPTGPTLPTGYTHWAYAASVFFNGSSQLVSVRVRGAWIEYQSRQSILSGGAGTSETAVGLTSVVPPNALRVRVNAQLTITASASASTGSLTLRYLSGLDLYQLAIAGIANGGQISETAEVTFPNQAQNMYYLTAISGGASAQSASLWALGYAVPNGSES
jgi:hypothetical protein